MSDHDSLHKGMHAGHDATTTVLAVETQSGVLKVENARRVWGPKSKIVLFLSIALAAYVYSLDGTTTYLYQAFATSSFSLHSALATVGVVNAIVIGVSKPIAAKLSDVIGRAEAFAVVIVFYTIGYIIIASSNGLNSFAGGNVLSQFGWASIQIMLQVIIGDMTTLRWRTLVASMVSLPFFINAFVGSNIGAAINETGTNGWRWGYGMFAIIIPATTVPIMLTLLWGQIQAKKLGVSADVYNDENVVVVPQQRLPFGKRLVKFAIDVDLAGLILFSAGWALLLIPMTLVSRQGKQWSSGDLIAMITLGPIILIAFVIFEAKFAPRPLFPLKFFKNKTILACALIDFFDFISFYLQFTYQYSFIYITHSEWSYLHQNYFAYTQTLSLTLFSVLSGLFALKTRRVRLLLIVGLVIRCVSVGAMIHTKGAHGTTAGLVLTQVFQGMGGGIASACVQTLAQGSVPHQNLATVTALVLLSAEIGNAIGVSIAGSIWRNLMPDQLTQNLSPYLNSTEIAGIFGSITTAVSYKGVNDAVFEGTIRAYDFTMGRLLIAATVLSVPPIICAFFCDDIYLGDTQNSVEVEEKTAGTTVAADHQDEKV